MLAMVLAITLAVTTPAPAGNDFATATPIPGYPDFEKTDNGSSVRGRRDCRQVRLLLTALRFPIRVIEGGSGPRMRKGRLLGFAGQDGWPSSYPSTYRLARRKWVALPQIHSPISPVYPTQHLTAHKYACSIKYKYYKQEVSIYIRAVKIERNGEQYGTYYQAVRSYREGGKVKQEVVHLGDHSIAESALESWPREVEELKRIGRPKQADKLEVKLETLQRLTKSEGTVH